MHFFDDSLLPENQEKLVIQVAPYGPEWLPTDSDDIPVSIDQQVQKAVDCYNAGATVLHVHVREADGKGSKKMSTFNEMLARLRAAVPKMVLQVGGSISFAPEGEGAAAKWPGIDTRHLLADLTPQPDQVTIVINTNQMSMVELMSSDDIAGTSLSKPEYYNAYKEMVTEAPPSFVEEHLKRLIAKKIQPHFMIGSIHQLGDGRTTDPPWSLHGAAGVKSHGARRRLRRPQSSRYARVRAPLPGRCGADDRIVDAYRTSDLHDGGGAWPARSSRRRGQFVAQKRRAIYLGAAGRTDGSHRARVGTRRGDRRRSETYLQDRHVLQECRRSACLPGLAAESASGSARISRPHARDVTRVAQDFKRGRGSLLTRFGVVIDGVAPMCATPALSSSDSSCLASAES